MRTADPRRQVVRDLVAAFEVSERRACEVVGPPRATPRQEPKAREDEGRLVARMVGRVRLHPRFGYRRIRALLVADGWRVSRKRVYRPWRANGLTVPQKGRKKRRLGSSGNGCVRRRSTGKDDVCCDEWGFSVWAHNADCAILFQQGEKWVLQSKVTGRTLFEGAEADVRAFAQKNGHDLTIPKAGDPLSAEHRAARWQEYQDSFKAGGERAGETPISQTAWDSKCNLNMGRMSRSQAGVNEYRAAHAPWAEPGEVYLKPSELPEGVAARHYDIANRVDKRAIEFKEFQGGQRPVASMNNDIKKEIAADVLMREKGGWNVEWVFKGYTSLTVLSATFSS